MSSNARREFWEKVAITALAEIVADPDVDDQSAITSAVECADGLTHAWSDRFEPKGRKAVA